MAKDTGQVRTDITFNDLVCTASAISLTVEQDEIARWVQTIH
ncbi:hypothetical protein [Roseibium sp. LAB1]